MGSKRKAEKQIAPQRKPAARNAERAAGGPSRAPSAAGERPSAGLLVAGAVFAGVSAVMSLLLVLEHLGGMRLPGCGEGSACAQAAESVWGKIPLGGLEWPVSYVGLAYFLAAMVTWVATRGVAPRSFRYVVRIGAVVSLGYCAVMIAKWLVCPYCIAAHLGNFAFWIVVERAGRRAARPRPQMAVATLGGTFVVATLALALWDAQHRAAVGAEAELARGAAAQEIIDRSTRGAAAPTADAQAPGLKAESTSTAPPATTEPMFTGRYRVGPAEAPIRIVMFTDYQCRDCYNIERQLVQLYEARNDISISIKHFPFNTECNPSVSSTLHPNACWAARAAEAAGMLWGPEGFWKMHVWLFEQRGVFETTQQLVSAIREMGYDPADFVRVMSGQETLRAIQADVAEAKRLGLYFTPMIFINGVELKGWVAPNALVRTVEQVAATNPPARSAAIDRPPAAFEKYVDDWRTQPRLGLPPDAQARTRGPEGARVEVVVWGDYQEPGSTKADAIIRAFASARDDVRYTYRHYPFNRDCNPQLNQTRFANSCRAAKAAEAAGRLGGNDGYWKMHIWLMENRERFSDESLRAAAPAMGFDADALLPAMEQPDVEADILDDIQAGKTLPQLRHGMPRGIFGIPTIFVNGRYVPRWQLDDEPVLLEVMKEAAK